MLDSPLHSVHDSLRRRLFELCFVVLVLWCSDGAVLLMAVVALVVSVSIVVVQSSML